MEKKLLIDAAHPEETRVVVAESSQTHDFDFENNEKTQITGNIYLAKVTRVEPSLQAAFLDYGGNRHGFLAFSEIHPDYYQIPLADKEALLAEQSEIAETIREKEMDVINSSALDASLNQTSSLEGSLDLNTHLVREPNATFFVRANGESMIGAGIHDGDLLVVDRSARVTDGKVVIVALNGELTVKRFRKEKGKSWLLPENSKFKPILLNEQDDTHLWGVVTSVIHSL